jgi:uncharacterized protein YkvS
MKILSKDQIKDQLGKHGMLATKDALINNTVVYMGGITEFDTHIEENKVNIDLTSIWKRPKGLELDFSSGWNHFRIAILFDNVNFWTIEQKDQIVAKKSKSIIGRALLGGVLLGPVGAVVGGMTGIGDKDVKVSDIDNVISLSYVEDGKEFMILFSCKDKKVQKVTNYLNRNLNNKFKDADEIKVEQNIEKKSEGIADEIMKLKELFDQGVLTEEEFNQQKIKLLSK